MEITLESDAWRTNRIMASFESLLNINFFSELHISMAIDPFSIENINL